MPVNHFVTLLQQGNSWLFVPSAVLLVALHGASWPAAQVRVETERADGTRKTFSFRHGGYLESAQAVREPHEFVARLRLGADRHSHDYDVEFAKPTAASPRHRS